MQPVELVYLGECDWFGVPVLAVREVYEDGTWLFTLVHRNTGERTVLLTY